MLGEDAASESDSKRDGFLSYAGEWHATAIGGAVGTMFGLSGEMWILLALATVIFTRKALPNQHLRDARREVAYTAGAFVVSWVLVTLATTLL